MPIDRELDSEVSDPIDRLVIALRAYVTRAPKKPKAGAKDKKYEKLGRRVGDWTPKGPTKRLGSSFRLRNPHDA